MEILAGNMDRYFERSGIKAEKTYEGKEYQVWELEQVEFDKLTNTNESTYEKDEWWRSSDGSNSDPANAVYIINGRKIKAWDGDRHAVDIEDGEEIFDREYSSLTEYFSEEMGASLTRNICALAVDLAKQNGIMMAELFDHCQSA